MLPPAAPEHTRPSARRALLDGLVDYAGLFPPAGLAMRPTVRHYAAYRAGPHAALLGRLVVPVARLGEFEAAASDLLPFNGDPDDTSPDDAPVAPWRLSALLGADPHALDTELAEVAAFEARHAPGAAAGRATIDVLEGRVAAPDAIDALAARVRSALPTAGARQMPTLYVEIPLADEPAPYAAAARAAGVRLKARLGGVTPDAIPAAERVLAFLAACHAAGVAAKATAGLHHAMAGEHPLTYEPGCARAAMFGFVGVFAAAALLRAGHAPDALLALLTERDAAALHLADDAIAWRGLAADAATVADARRHGLVAFGSCSFEEPAGELRALGWLPTADLPSPV